MEERLRRRNENVNEGVSEHATLGVTTRRGKRNRTKEEDTSEDIDLQFEKIQWLVSDIQTIIEGYEGRRKLW